MVDINKGQYLYNLQTGKTIGVAKEKAFEKTWHPDGTVEYKAKEGFDENDFTVAANYRCTGFGAKNTDGEYMDFWILGNGDDISSQEFLSTYNACANKEIQYGTVADLTLDQIINLFLSGNMEPSEAVAGLEAKGFEIIEQSTDSNPVVIKYSKNNKVYTISCAKDAAASQLDDIVETSAAEERKTVENHSSSIGVRVYESMGCPGTEKYEEPVHTGYLSGLDNRYFVHGYALEDLFTQTLNRYVGHGLENLDGAEFYDALDKLTGTVDFQNLTGDELTEACKKSIQDANALFHNNNMSGNGFGPDAMMLEEIIKFAENRGWIKSADDIYCEEVANFVLQLSCGESRFDMEHRSPISAFDLDSNNNVTINEKTPQAFYDYIQNNRTESQQIMDWFGISKNDDVDTIRQKLQNYFVENGGTADSINLEDYYNSLSPQFTESYEKIQNDYDEYFANIHQAARKEKQELKDDYKTPGVYDMLGNGTGDGPNGWISTAADGVYITKTSTADGREGYTLYYYDPKTDSYTGKFHEFEGDLSWPLEYISKGMSIPSEWNVELPNCNFEKNDSLSDEELAYINASLKGYSLTSADNVYAKDGKYYTYNVNSGKFTETTAVSSDVQVYTDRTGHKRSSIIDENYDTRLGNSNYVYVEENGIDILNDGDVYEPCYDWVDSEGVSDANYKKYDAPAGQYPVEGSKGNTPEQYKNQSMLKFANKGNGASDTAIIYYAFDIEKNENNIGDSTITYGKEFENKVRTWLTDGLKQMEEEYNDIELRNRRLSQGLCPYNPEQAFTSSDFYQMLFGEKWAITTNPEKYFEKLHEYLDNPEKFNSLIQNFYSAAGLDSNGKGKLETVYNKLADVGIQWSWQVPTAFHDEDYFERQAKTNTFLLNFKEEYPELYDKWEGELNGNFNRSEDQRSYGDVAAMIYDGLLRVDTCADTALLDDPSGLPGLLCLAAGIDASDNVNSKRIEKLNKVLNKISNGGSACDIVDVAQYLLGNNPSGVNWFATYEEKLGVIEKETQELQNYLENYNDEHKTVTVVPRTVPQDKLPDDYISTEIPGMYIHLNTQKITEGKYAGAEQCYSLDIKLWNQETQSFVTITRRFGNQGVSLNLWDESKTKEEIVAELVNDAVTRFKNGTLNEGLATNDYRGTYSIAYGGANSEEAALTYCMYTYGMNYTSEDGVYEKDGKFYKFDIDAYYNVTNIGDVPSEYDYTHINLAGKFDKIFTEVKRNLTSDVKVDTSIKAGKIEDTKPSEIKESDLQDIVDITNYIKEVTKDIYNKYWETEGTINDYKYFGKYGLNNNVDSAHYLREGWKWTDEEAKKACFEEFNNAAKKILDKYGDKIKELVFDGEKFLFTTDAEFNCDIHEVLKNYGKTDWDNGNLGSGQTSTTWDYLYSGTELCSNGGRFAAYYSGDGKNSYFREGGVFEACCDKPVIYTSFTVYNSDAPEEVPEDPNGGYLLKTGVDGVLVSTADQQTYLWDEKRDMYISAGMCILDAWNGHTGRLTLGDNAAINALYISTLFGYHQTSDPYIFERGGKFYTVDMDRLNAFRGEVALVESELFEEVKVTEIDYTHRNKTDDKKDQKVGDKKDQKPDDKQDKTVNDKKDPKVGGTVQPNEGTKVTTKTVEETQNDLMNLVQLYLNISNPISKEEFFEKADEVVADAKAIEEKDETAAEQFIISKNEDYEPVREEAANENGYVETEQGSCLYTPKESEDKDKTYVYEPVSSMFVEYTPDANAADSVKQQIILQRALLMAQLMKLDFTIGYPLICKKDGVYYKFDESQMTFVKA